MTERAGKLLPLRRSQGAIAELSDEALLAACATGDSAALGALFDRFNVAVYRFAARLATTDELARDDLVQSTFLAVQRNAAAYRGVSSVKTWILGVAANVARHQLRGEQRRRVHQAKFVEDLDAVAAAPDAELDRKKLLRQIAVAIAALPHEHQVAFILCDLEQLPGADVARALDISEPTLWRRLGHARRAVRAAVERRSR